MKILLFCSLFIFHSAFCYAQNNLHERAKKALNYAQLNKLNTEFCLLIDYSIHSGKNRIFLWSFDQDTVLLSGLCSHGCGNFPWAADSSKEKVVFSNKEGSHLSSLGKYKIGKRGYSNWGIHVNYKLHGLESSNSLAYKRFIVLHSWNKVSEVETFPEGCPEGWGCPAVSNLFMIEFDALMKKHDYPETLLWIYSN